ncbi:MAG: hypothetical protein HYY37_04220 [Candidatus Aenigmarchaeota archaeon]|nr:hypothetical protein [Candidatus Aenigmarchaeota archaeon]
MYHFTRYAVVHTDSYSSRRRFGTGDAGGFPALYSYPSYLGIDIVTLSRHEMPDSLLGFTDGRHIAMRESIDRAVREFVLLHEEEHVKDMEADEFTVDLRAFRRLVQRADRNRLEKVLELLGRRWKDTKIFEEIV